MKSILFALALLLLNSPLLLASQSVITDVEGYACMGDDKSRKATEQAAIQDAKRKAAEAAVTYIRSETSVKNAMLEHDLMSAYANALVKVVQEVENGWYKDAAAGDCYRTKVKLEVIPDEKTMTRIASKETADDPAAPLGVKVWTDKQSYQQGDKIRVYLKGNKPFYAKVVYKDAGNNLIQLLPNPYRANNYFNGGSVYEIPGGDDRYELMVEPPFGSEGITVYAGTAPLGELDVEQAGSVYTLKTQPKDVPLGTRGVKILAKGSSSRVSAAEFTESEALIKTGK